jgi:Predicted metal-binding integral membrane protein (DUF2182)
MNNLVAYKNHLSFTVARVRVFFMQRPEWWTILFSVFVWTWLVMNLSTIIHNANQSGTIRYCMPAEEVKVAEHSGYEKVQTFKESDLVYKISDTISNGFWHWIIMVFAMMFLLLTEPIRHVAFSLRPKDKQVGILSFLVGYTIVWAITGLFFLLLPVFLDWIIVHPSSFVNGLVKASGFLLAAILIWQPTRPVKMTRCGQTMPIRIDGWQQYWDCLYYGCKMGLACLNMCWIVMVGLVLAQHNLMLMYLVTIVLIYERYLLPHTSKLPAYAWTILGLVLFGIEVWG